MILVRLELLANPVINILNLNSEIIFVLVLHHLEAFGFNLTEKWPLVQV